MREKIIEKIWQIFFDTIGILLAFVLAYFLRLRTLAHGEFPFGPYFEMGILITLFWIILLIISGRYELKEQDIWEEIKGILFASLSSSLLFPLAFYFTSERFFSRGIVVLIFVLGVLFLLLLSILRKKILAQRVKNNCGIFRMLIIGADRNSQRIVEQLLNCSSHHKPVAILAPYGSKQKKISGIKIFGKLDALERIFEQEKIDEIFLCEGIEHSENLASFCRNKGIPLKTSLETMGIYHHKILAETVGNTTFLTLHQSPLFGWGQFIKRIFDIIFASIGVIIFTPYYIWNKKFLKKILYQTGENSTFEGYIFEQNTTDGKKIFGKKIALLLSVLQKNLSIVGPKIFSHQEFTKKFSGKEKISQMRFILRPGIFSPTTKNSPEEMLRNEVLYIRNWSFWGDLKIVWKNF